MDRDEQRWVRLTVNKGDGTYAFEEVEYSGGDWTATGATGEARNARGKTGISLGMIVRAFFNSTAESWEFEGGE